MTLKNDYLAENEGSGREAAKETAITLLEFKANYPSYLDRSLNKLLAPDTVDSVLLKERPRVRTQRNFN